MTSRSVGGRGGLAALWLLATVLLPAEGARAQTKTVNTVQTPARVGVNAAPSILIPPSSIGIDLCLGEASGAYASPMLAITLSGPQRDEDCTDLRLSKWALDLQPGHPALAYQIACASRTWREADAVTERLCIPEPRPWWRFW